MAVMISSHLGGMSSTFSFLRAGHVPQCTGLHGRVPGQWVLGLWCPGSPDGGSGPPARAGCPSRVCPSLTVSAPKGGAGRGPQGTPGRVSEDAAGSGTVEGPGWGLASEVASELTAEVALRGAH